MAQRKYSGKYPFNIRQVCAKNGTAWVTTNNGNKYVIYACSGNAYTVPKVGQCVSKWLPMPNV